MTGMTGKVFLACALGGGVGALVALQMWQPFWWVGMLVGGLVGYLAYEFDEVRRAILLAWRKVTEWRPSTKMYWYIWCKVFTFVFSSTVNTFVGMCVLLLPIYYAVYGSYFLLAKGIWILLFGVGTCLLLAAFIACLEAIDMSLEERYFITCPPNVFRLYLWIVPRAIGEGVWMAVTRGPRWTAGGVVIIARFLWQVFLLVHSEMRLLCGLDAAIGAAIGYWLGNAIIGAIAGGVFGIANFEIVSKWWLKLVPIK